MDAYSIYIHIPFCRHRCAYCDFNTYAKQEHRIPEYVEALLREIQCITDLKPEPFPIHTVYFGGGTPSLLSISDIKQVIDKISKQFQLLSGSEISLEANPGTLSEKYLRALREIGVNRISLGMQSGNSQELEFLERQHRFEDVTNAVNWARRAGFDNLSLDLIFGLPEQSIETWEESLNQAINLAPEHFSLYALTIESGTPLGRWAARGMVPMPDPDRAADMYEIANAKLTDAGYLQYEISNWAKMKEETPLADSHSPDLASRHNLQYWRNQPYFGFGAGAHGFVNHSRTTNVLAPGSYIKRLSKGNLDLAFPKTPATVEIQTIDRETEMGETMMMGLRLTREGVSRKFFQTRFNIDMALIYQAQIQKMKKFGLLEWSGPDNDRLRLTPQGYFLGNQVFSEFV